MESSASHTNPTTTIHTPGHKTPTTIPSFCSRGLPHTPLHIPTSLSPTSLPPPTGDRPSSSTLPSTRATLIAPVFANLLSRKSVILLVERPILSLMLSFRHDIRADDERDTSNGTPMVGRTRTQMERLRSRLLLWCGLDDMAKGRGVAAWYAGTIRRARRERRVADGRQVVDETTTSGRRARRNHETRNDNQYLRAPQTLVWSGGGCINPLCPR